VLYLRFELVKAPAPLGVEFSSAVGFQCVAADHLCVDFACAVVDLTGLAIGGQALHTTAAVDV
jgi:hypothetical protein